MKEKIKIVLGKKDVFPYENNDTFVNLELSRDSDELVNEIINNNFNLNDQFIKERERSLKFCVYGICEANFANTENTNIQISTNHLDSIYAPKFSTNIEPKAFHNIKTVPLSYNGRLSKNIFLNKKSSYYFIFELSPIRINNLGETKELILKIRNDRDKVYANIKIPFLHYNSEGVKIPFGTETVEIDLNGNQTIVDNDYKFLYDTHWIRADLNLLRPPKVSFLNSLENEFINNATSLLQNPQIQNTSKEVIDELQNSINNSFQSTDINNATIEESFGKVDENFSEPFEFFVKLDYPSVYGIEEVDVIVKEDGTVRNPNKDFIFTTKTLKWDIGEQYKKVSVEIVDDLFVEDTENVTFGFNNFKYVDESDTNNEFFLTIEDKDKPIPVRFAIPSQEVLEGDKTLSIDVFLDRPMNVPNQTVTVYADLAECTAIIGENFLGTDSTTVNTTVEQVNYTINIDVNTRVPFPSLFGGSNKAGKIVRKDGGSFLDDGFSVGSVITYNSQKNGIPIDTNLEIKIIEVTTDTLLLENDSLFYSRFPNRNENIEASFSFEFEREIFGKFEKVISLREGVSSFKFDIDILNDFSYSNDLNIKLKLKDPTQNAIISPDVENEHIITIKDSMIPNFTRFVIPGNKEKGFGMFRMNDYLLTERQQLNLLCIDAPPIVPPSTLTPGALTSDFKYTITVTNLGEPIFIEDESFNIDQKAESIELSFPKGTKYVGTNEIVTSFNVETYSTSSTSQPEISAGFKTVKIDLPSNFGLKKQLNQFLKTKYKIQIEAEPIQSTSSFASTVAFGQQTTETAFINSRKFSKVTIDLDPNGNEATPLAKNSTYFLTSRLESINTRIFRIPTGVEQTEVVDENGNVITFNLPTSILRPRDEIVIPALPPVTSSNILKRIEMNGTVFLSDVFENPNVNPTGFFAGGIFGETYTKVLERKFSKSQIEYITCSATTYNDTLIPCEAFPSPYTSSQEQFDALQST